MKSQLCAGGFAAALLTLACTVSCAAQTTAPAPAAVNPDPARYLYEDAIKPGQKGYGLTCISGGKIERFEFTVIDVIKNLTPGNNAVLVRCSGLGLEHSGIIAGMSGSPCYIDGKMIGAIAYGWALGKDPIAGVQPIRQMLAIPVHSTDPAKNPGATQAASTRWRSNTGLAAAARKTPGYDLLARNLARLTPETKDTWNSATRAAGLRPLATPLMVSGASTKATSFLTDSLEGTSLVPVASGSTGGSGAQLGGVAELRPGDIKLEPGSSIAIPMVTGDLDLSAIGTVTEVRNGKVYAFGHAMFAEGATHLPISTGYIYTIMPNLQQSFKMGASYQPQGTLVTDEQTGIVGVMGDKPKTVPIRMHVKSSDGTVDHTYNYRLAPHPRLTPDLFGTIIAESVLAQRGLPKQFTLTIGGDIKFHGASMQVQVMGSSAGFNLMNVIMPVAMLSDNPFKNLELEEIVLDATIEPTNRSATIKSVSVKDLTVAPGDTVSATVEFEPFQQAARKVTIQIQVPPETPDGQYDLAVGGASMALMHEEEHFPHRFDPQDIDTLVGAMQNVLSYRQDKLYARLVLDIEGAAQRGKEFANLPPSRMALFASDKLKDTSPLHKSVVATQDVGLVLDGGETFTIKVDKNANKRFYSDRKEIFPQRSRIGPVREPKMDRAVPHPSTEPGED